MFIGYHILIKFFKDGNIENNWKKEEYLKFEKNSIEGDLQGIIEKLDYLQDLGIDLIYLGPIYESKTTHGYDTINYYKIASHLSSKEENKRNEVLKKLLIESHKRGIKVILDLVLNHASKNYDMKSIKNFNVKTEPPQSIQEKRWQTLFQFWNISDIETRKFLIDVGKYWLENFDVDGFRLDHALGIERSFWKEFSKEMKKIKSDVILLGEVWDDVADEEENYELIKKFKSFENEKIFTSLFDFFIYDVLKDVFIEKNKSLKDFYKMISKSNELNDTHFNLTYFVENHDVPRFIDLCKNKEIFFNVMKVLMVITGNVMLEYGNEIALAGDKNFEWFHESGRVPMKFKKNWNLKEIETFNLIKKLIKIRKENKELSDGSYELIYSSDDSILFKKKLNKKETFVLITFKTFKADYEFEDLISNEKEINIFEPGVYYLKRVHFF
ncbi:hypothetical protein OSSY52_16820 [Tepiditoga spiralis]|uniref:Glycosyl hydrolase family 13 catalytic domain-containing protein n=1 Tax=Tepiditoga spiralis TaxID=2108365 RepID=A0A7G1G567_9BACT|nr:alpha-amylase family glycosyl hydrolase [Tepiditoga spiralis]BBE31541.1 hypothetical protein OSSY52_16820 [Tepiditoga spiralis]